ncbi:MAG TPA: type VI secretion system-associated protein TagO [Xanthomonadaceae bacterium]|nr:type VI secretion system-associated protein TagO [Xanthomonadaceae bacterium]
MLLWATAMVALGLGGAGSAAAEEVSRQDLARCAAMGGALMRLACYDELAKQARADGPAVTTETPPGGGGWTVKEEVSPIDDSRRVILMLHSDEPIRDRFGRPTKVPIVLRCSENQTAAYVAWNSYLGSSAPNVLTRFDRQPARTVRWSLSTDSRATFVPQPVAWIKQLLESEMFLAQVTPYSESPVTAIWTLSGIQEAVKPLREACGW